MADQIIAGYRIVKQLGEGGMGAVFLGEKDGVKAVLKEATQCDPQELLREAQFLASLRHPLLPKVIDFQYGHMIMELVEGETLEQFVESRKVQPNWNTSETYLNTVLDLMLQMTDVLNYLHSQKPYPVIHRDLKPPNVIIRPSGKIKLIDFGIARHFKPENLNKNIKDTVAAGTEGYMAPEFVMLYQSTPLCDIYSFGVVMHFLLSGEEPDPNGVRKRLSKLARTGETLWDTLVQISEKCKHPEPSKRYQSCGQLAAELIKLTGEELETPSEKPCSHCSALMRSSCCFCPHCGAEAFQVKGQDETPKVNINLLFSGDHGEVMDSVIQAVHSNSGAPLERFRVYQRLRELDQDPGFGELISLDSLAKVSHLPHQIDAVRTALQRMRGWCLLADEVGLGKTIEAGIIIKELTMRDLVKRILIISPKALCTQWQQELFDKFDMFFVVFGMDVDYSLAWQCDRVIAPYGIIDERFHRLEILDQDYDLVIMDESHHLVEADPRRGWLLKEFARRLRKKYFLMLSATPLHNDLEELHTLLTLLKPGVVGDYRSFEQKYIDPKNPFKAKNVEELRGMLHQVMIRHRRIEVAELQFPRRQAYRRPVSLNGSRKSIFEEFRQLVKNKLFGLSDISANNSYVRSEVQNLVESFHSSPKAFEILFERFRTRFRNMIPSDVMLDLIGFRRTMTAELIEPKIDTVLDLLLRHHAASPESKMLIFSQYDDSADLLYERLAALSGLHLVRYPSDETSDGGQRAVEVLEIFREEATAMVCSANASEGLNLQFADTMINFDLPWDPMKIEQRIGRIQRLGQKSDEVYIYNLFFEGTVEEDILQVLENKIMMFGDTVGQTEEIIGNLAEDESFDQVFFDLFLHADDAQATKFDMDRIDVMVTRDKNGDTGAQILDAVLFG